MITVYQAQGSNVPPLADARLYELLSGGGVGVVLGCEITSLGGLQLLVGAGWVLLPGRCIAIEEETITVTPSTGAQVDGQLLLHLDVSSDDAPGTWVTNAETPLPAPVQEDVNGSGTIYELQMCAYKVDQLQVTELQTTYPVLGTAASYLYKATFDMDSWMPGSGNVTQTATLVPVDGGPPVTSNSTLLAYEGTDSTLPQETKDAMSGPAGLIAKADKTLGDNTITVTLDSAPDVDVEIFFSIKRGVTPAVPPLDPVGAGAGKSLLWTNPTPEAEFNPQDIELNLSGYSFLYIEFLPYGSQYEQWAGRSINVFPVGYTGNLSFALLNQGGGQTSALLEAVNRLFNSDVSGVHFQNGVAVVAGGKSTLVNAWVIPTKIWGER